jgi:hypothetical protein
MSDRNKKPPAPDDVAPPGEFVSDDLRDETARFLEEVKRRIKKSNEPNEQRLGPPRRRHNP